jgi:hypothetical protein
MFSVPSHHLSAVFTLGHQGVVRPAQEPEIRRMVVSATAIGMIAVVELEMVAFGAAPTGLVLIRTLALITHVHLAPDWRRDVA